MRNHEKYYDPTAGIAIKNVEAERKDKKEMSQNEFKKGDIFYIQYDNDNCITVGSEQYPNRPAVIVSNNTGNHYSNTVSVAWLTTAEKKPLPTHTTVMAKVPSIVLCEQITTISKERIMGYIKTCTEEEMKRIDECLQIALALTDEAIEIQDLFDDMENEIEELQAETDNLLKTNEKLVEEAKTLRKDYEALKEERIDWIGERNKVIDENVYWKGTAERHEKRIDELIDERVTLIDEKESLEKAYNDLKENYLELQQNSKQIPQQANNEEIIKLRTERDLYKKLFEDMLQRAIGD